MANRGICLDGIAPERSCEEGNVPYNPHACAKIDAVFPRWRFIPAMAYDRALETYFICTAIAVHPPCLHIIFHASSPVFISHFIIIVLIFNIILIGVFICQSN